MCEISIDVGKNLLSGEKLPQSVAADKDEFSDPELVERIEKILEEKVNAGDHHAYFLLGQFYFEQVPVCDSNILQLDSSHIYVIKYFISRYKFNPSISLYFLT